MKKTKDKFFIRYNGKSMKDILEEYGINEWNYSSSDTAEFVEAPDTDWIDHIIFELTEILGFNEYQVIKLLEEYFKERKNNIINEWRELAARKLDLFPEEYNHIKEFTDKQDKKLINNVIATPIRAQKRIGLDPNEIIFK